MTPDQKRHLVADTICNGFAPNSHVYHIDDAEEPVSEVCVKAYEQTFEVFNGHVVWPNDCPAEVVAAIDLDIRSAIFLAEDTGLYDATKARQEYGDYSV